MSAPGRAHFLGSALILAGTAIGAGMLALPFVAIQIGFFPTILVFLITAFFMAFAGLLMLEANLSIGPGCSLYVMAAKVLGRPGKVVATVAPLGLFYSLMVAYLVGGGGLIKQLVSAAFSYSMSIQLCITVFALVASIVVWNSTKAVDYINRFLFLLMLVAFLAAVLALFPGIQYTRLTAIGMSRDALWVVLPVVFTSFGFHGTIPSLILYQRDNLDLLPKAFVSGTLLAFLFYVVWLIISMGNLDGNTFSGLGKADGTVGGLIHQLSLSAAAWEYTEVFLYAFSDLALLTSVLGVSLGLFDYLASLFQRQESVKGRFQTSLLTFLPPLVCAIFFPDGFIAALGYAAVALSVLAVLLPTAIVWKLRQSNLASSVYRVPGGRGLLFCSFLFGSAVILLQLLGSMGVL